MKKSTFTPAQIAGVLKEFDGGKSAEEITREHGVAVLRCINGGSAMAVWRPQS